MLILPNVGQTAASTAAKARTDNTAPDQDFNQLLSAKVGQVAQAPAVQGGDATRLPSGAVDAPRAPAADDIANGQTAAAERADNAVVAGEADVASPSLSDGGNNEVKTPLAAADDADPALDATAAQALMALLAQTQPGLVSDMVASAGATGGGSALGTRYGTIDGHNSGMPTGTTNGANDGSIDGAMPADAEANPAGGLGAAGADGVSGNPALAPGATAGQGALLAALLPKDSGHTVTDVQPASPANTSLDKPLKSAAGGNQRINNADDADGSALATAAGQGMAAPVSARGGYSDAVAGALGGTAAARKIPVATEVSPAAAHMATPTLSAAGDGATATPAPASALISAQLGSDEWQQAIGQQVVMFSRNGQQNAELRLHPDTLGAIQISLQIDNNQAQIHLASGHSQVRAALEAALPQLRTALAESGISLGQSSVGSEATPNWADGQSGNAPARNARGFTLTQNPAETGAIAAASGATRALTGIDTFV